MILLQARRSSAAGRSSAARQPDPPSPIRRRGNRMTLSFILLTMKSKLRKLLLGALFTYFAVEMLMIQSVLGSSEGGGKEGLVALDILLTTTCLLYIFPFCVADQLASRAVVLFDALIFSTLVAWLILALPHASSLAIFYALNLLTAVGLLATDVWIFSRMSSVRKQGEGQCSSQSGEVVTEAFAAGTAGTAGAGAYDNFSSLHTRNTSNAGDTANTVIKQGGIEHLTLPGVCHGFRINLSALPEFEPLPHLDWDSFSQIRHMVDSSSCHIYTARWGDLPVILKLIKADRVAYSVALQEFQVEESVLGRVRHPNIVRLLGEGSAPRKFLVLEHLSGGTLSHSLGMTESRLKTFSLLETLRMAHALATALNYLHNEWSDMVHLIHRDLKPDNVGWSADGVLKLFDFGLCTAVKRQRERTEQYQLTGNTGTLRYMAPEVVLSRSYHMSVDTYSFGILVWQIGAGKIPFKDMGKKAYVEQVAIQGLRPPLPSHWPVGFAQLLQVCWHEDKNVRPSFAEVISRLDGLIEEEGQGQRRNSQHLPLRPVLALIAAALIAAAFYLAATGPASVSAGSAVLAYISALALYALLLSMCDAWPLAPVPVRPGGGVLSETGSGGGDRKPPEDLEIGSHTLRSSALTVDLVEEAINPINSCLS